MPLNWFAERLSRRPAVWQNLRMAQKHGGWRRGIKWLLIAGLVFVAGAYLYLTNSGRLRRQLLLALEQLPIKALTLDDISFSPWHGLEVGNLHLELRGPGSLADDAQCLRAVVQVERARVRCRLGALLQGNFVPRSATLDQVDMAVFLPKPASAVPPGGPATPPGDTGAADLAAAATSPAARSFLQTLRGMRIPALRLGDTNIRVSQTDAQGTHLVRHWRVTGSGAWAAGKYGLELRRTGDAGEPLFTLRWDPERATCESACDWLDLDTLAVFFPQIADTWSDLGLRGRGRVQRIVISTRPDAVSLGGLPLPLSAADVQLAGLRCSIPIEEPEAGQPPIPAWRRFLQVSNAELSINCTPEVDGPGLVKLTGTGLINRAVASFRLTADLGALVNPAASLADLVSADLRVTGMEFPTPAEHAAFISSPKLPHSIRCFFDDFQPSGFFDLVIWARQARDAETGRQRLAVDGWIDAQGMRCRYHTFPYEFSDAHGRTTFSARGLDLDITARHGPAHITATGRVNRPGHATGFDLTITGTGVPLDDDLAEALQTSYRRLWDQTEPRGTCDATVRLQREDGPPDVPGNPPTKTVVSADLVGGSIRLESDKRLEQATGHFEIAEGSIDVQDLRGYLDTSPALVAGTVAVDSGEADLRIAATDVPIKRSVAVDQFADGTPAQIQFDGQADVAGRIHSAGDSGKRDDAYVVQLRRGTLTGFDSGLQWTDCHGSLVISDRENVLGSFEAHQDEAVLTASGTLPGARGGPITLDVNIAHAAMDKLARQLIPPRWGAQAEALGLGGVGDMQLQLRPEGEPGEERQVTEIRFSAENMRPSVLPLEVADVQAHARIDGDSLEVLESQGRYGAAGQLELKGKLTGGGDGSRARFSATARDIDLSPSVAEALPGGLASLLRRLDAQGRLQLDINGARSAEQEEVSWNFDGQLWLSNGALRLGLPLAGVEGGLSGTCHIDRAGQVSLDGLLRIESGTLAGRRIEGLAGEIQYHPSERWVSLEDLRGQVCGGDAVGFVHVDPATSEYELSVTFQNVAMNEFLSAQALRSQRPLTGRRGFSPSSAMHTGVLDGYVFLRGNSDDPASRRGGGQLRVSSASIIQTPVAAEVAEANPHAEPGASDALDRAELRFTWEGAELHFTRLELLSEDLHLAGEGTWNMDSDEVAMTLVGAHPRNWPGMAVLSGLLETTERQLVQYQVTGTLAAPQVRAEPLYRLTEALRALISSGE
jgi:hypothetical protein